jgi:hypothetical protein
VSFFEFLNSSGSLMLQCFGIPHRRLAEQFLKFPPVVERLLHSRYQFVGYIDGEAFSLYPRIQEIAGMLLPLQAGFAVLADAGTPTQTQRTQCSGPKSCCMILKPLLNIYRRFVLPWHVVRIPYGLRIVKRNLLSAVMSICCEFRDRN